MIIEPIGLAVFLFQTRVLCLIKPGIIGEFFRYLYRDLVFYKLFRTDITLAGEMDQQGLGENGPRDLTRDILFYKLTENFGE